MGSRGPVARKGKAGARSLTSADGVRLRRLPADADAIARRLARDIAGLTAADVALVEDMARWIAISTEAFRQLREPLGGQPQEGGQPQQPQQQMEDVAIKALLALLMTDTAHGNKEESRKSPLLIVMRTASEQIRANAAQLGASPMSRARLPEPEQDDKSIADILFAGVGAADGGQGHGAGAAVAGNGGRAGGQAGDRRSGKHGGDDSGG